MRTHELKTWPTYFEAILSGAKRFEVRKNDRDFAVGDVLVLREWDPAPAGGRSAPAYTGRQFVARVTYLMRIHAVLPMFHGYVVMSIAEQLETAHAAVPDISVLVGVRCACGEQTIGPDCDSVLAVREGAVGPQGARVMVLHKTTDCRTEEWA